MSYRTSTLQYMLCALLLVHSIAVRTVPEWTSVVSRSSVLQASSTDAGIHSWAKHHDAPRCTRGRFIKRYYFDLPSADANKPEDDRAVVLFRDPQDPKLVVYNHAHWRISQKTKDAKLVGLPQWTPVDSSPKIPQRKIVIDLYNQTDFVRQSMAEGLVKFELTQMACSEKPGPDDGDVKEKVNTTQKVCGLSFVGGTYYPKSLVKAALRKIGDVWNDKDRIDINSSQTSDVNVKLEPSKRDKTMKYLSRIALFTALAPIPAFFFIGEFGPLLLNLVAPSAFISHYARKQRRSSKNRTSAAEKLFEKIYCLSGICARDGKTCMAKCKDPENEENHVVMPRSRVKYATTVTCM